MVQQATFETAREHRAVALKNGEPGHIQALLRHAEQALASDIPTARSYLLRIITVIDSQMYAPTQQTRTIGLANWQIKKVQEYVETHLAEPISLTALSGLARMSAPYFCKVFRKSFKVSPGDYIKRQRVMRAQEMMLSTHEPLSQIALACGFADQPHFCRVFRQVAGQTPSHWRRLHQMEPQPRPGSQTVALFEGVVR